MENEKFEIKDLSDVNSVMATIRNIEKKKAENEEFATKEIERTQTWLDKENGTLDNKIEYYKGMLIEYYHLQKQSNPKLKTLSVPNGKFKARTSKKIKYEDSKMLEYLKQNHSALVERETIESFNKNEVKKIIKDGIDIYTGEILDWVTESTETTYSVKITE